MSKRDINKVFDLDLVVGAMEAYCPRPKRSSGKTYRQIAETYRLMVVSHALLKSRTTFEIRFNLYNLALEDIRVSMGRYSLGNKKQMWWRYWFEQQSFSLYEIKDKGSKIMEKNSTVKLNFDLATANEVMSWDVKTILASVQTPEDVDGYWYTQVDQSSLQAYINSTEAAIKSGVYDKKSGTFNPLNSRQREVYQDNLKTAQAIRVLSAETGELRQAAKISPFGRIYLKGINLQNCHKIIRTAALGDCYSYDLNTSSQAWRIHQCELIESGKYPFTKELLQNKMIFRRRVAHIMNTQDIDLAKTVITAIGFGADLNSKAWPNGDGYSLPALKQILTDTQLTLLNNSNWFMGFINEQQHMNNVIYKHFKQNFKPQDYPECIKDAGGKIVRNKALAWLYQNAETSYVDAVLSYISAQAPEAEILLTCHDAVYVKHKVNTQNLQGVCQQLNPHLSVEVNEHRAYTFEDVFGILAHKEQIQAEETDALRYQLAKMQHAGWDDVEYKSSHKLFGMDRDGMLDRSLWTDAEQQEYQRLHDLYYMTWFKDVIMGKKNWRSTEEFQRWQSMLPNTDFSDGSDHYGGYYSGYYDGNK